MILLHSPIETGFSIISGFLGALGAFVFTIILLKKNFIKEGKTDLQIITYNLIIGVIAIMISALAFFLFAFLFLSIYLLIN